MTKKLFSTYTVKDVTLKNRIVMSPMCMYSANTDGMANDFHVVHYGSRALGQVGLIMVEATAVKPEGRITNHDLGIWSDEHVDGLSKIVHNIHAFGSHAAIQLAHAGRKSETDGKIYAPSAISFDENYKVPEEMTLEDIANVVEAFKNGARRAKEAGFDIIELHAAHGYLLSEFLSPLSNKRNDEYGGSEEKRYRLLKEVIQAVKEVWDGPLFVRISANEYSEEGNSIDTFITYAKRMKEQGVDLIDCSSGAIIPARIRAYPGYQVPYADTIRSQANIATGTVGLITNGMQAEEILRNERADLVFIGRELLRDPFWPRTAATQLHTTIPSPVQYERGW